MATHSVSDMLREANAEIQRLREQYDRLAEHRAKAESDLRTVEQERDAALAEVERFKTELKREQQKVRVLRKSHGFSISKGALS